MSDSHQLLLAALAILALAGCASTTPPRAASVACNDVIEASPPSAAAPTGPTAMSPPPGHPRLMNPTVPMEVSTAPSTSTAPSNMGFGGARTPSTEATSAIRNDCVRVSGARD